MEKPTSERQTKRKNSVEAYKACIAEANADAEKKRMNDEI